MFDVETYGEGEPVVMLHGVALPPESLAPIRRRLASSHRVVVPETSGFDCEPAEVFDVLEETLSSEGIERAPVVGHSIGAFRAFRLALLETIDVERIAAIGARAHIPDSVRAEIEQLIEAIEAGALEPSEVLVDRWFSEAYREEHPETVETLVGWIEELGSEAIADGARADVQAPDLRPRLGEIDVPVYLQTGEKDAATPVEWAREIAGALPDAELEIIEGSGHFPFVEAPEESIPPIERFLS